MGSIFVYLNVFQKSVNDIDKLDHIVGDIVLIHLFFDKYVLNARYNL